MHREDTSDESELQTLPSNQPRIPSAERILEAYRELGTQTSVATFFGVSRRTILRWTEKPGLEPEFRPEIPVNQMLSSSLSESESRVRIAQWIMDEASITVAYDLRSDSTSLMVAGAMNDHMVLEPISKGLGVAIVSGAAPAKGRLPMHIVRVQGARAYSLLCLLSKELTGLKALEAKAALAYFPPSGFVKG